MRTIFLALLLAGGAYAGPALELPKEVKGDPGAFLQVPAKTDGKVVRWKAVDPGLNLFPVELLKDTKTAVVTAARPGRYRLLAVTARGDEPSDIAETVVVVGEAPAPPEPGPGPTPPPDSDFARAVKAAYASETAADKAKLVGQLAALYRQASAREFLDAVPTAGALFSAMAAAAQTLGVSGKLPAVQKAVQSRLVKDLPTEPSAALTLESRGVIAGVFREVAAALEAAGK